MRAALLVVVVLFAGCVSQEKLHATALSWTHGVIDTAGRGLEDGCVLAVERAPSVERAREVASGCRRAAEVQHALVEAWMTWASAVLVKLEGKKFDLGVARTFAARAVGFYRELDVALEGFDVLDLPDLPPLLLQLVADNEE